MFFRDNIYIYIYILIVSLFRHSNGNEMETPCVRLCIWGLHMGTILGSGNEN